MWSLIVCLLCVITTFETVSSQAYNVEIYFVAEKRVIDRYIKEVGGNSTQAMINYNADLDYFITEMNKMYRSLNNFGLNIQVSKRASEVLLTENVFSSSPPNSDIALKKFKKWLDKRDAVKKVVFDEAVLFTNLPLYGDNKNQGIVGVAWVGEACLGSDAMAIITHDMTYETIVTMAHEVAHSLGAEHDRLNKYIMGTDTPRNSPDRWFFSRYSYRKMRAYVSSIRPNCLLKNEPGTTTVNAEVSPALVNPDTVCKRSLNNSKAFLFKDPWYYDTDIVKGDAVCGEIQCGITGGQEVTPATASDGMICDLNKRCSKGRCKQDRCANHPDSAAAKVNPKCIWGDQASIHIETDSSFFEGTCQEYIKKYGRYQCHYPDMQDMCCHTCPRRRRRDVVDILNGNNQPHIVRITETQQEKKKFGGDVSLKKGTSDSNGQRRAVRLQTPDGEDGGEPKKRVGYTFKRR